MPALHIYLALPRILIVEHPVVGDPVLGLSQRFIVSFRSEFYELCPVIFQKGEFFRLLKTPDESEVSVFRSCQHVLIHCFRRVAVTTSGESPEINKLVIYLPEWIIKSHLGAVCSIPAASEHQTECLVLLRDIEYYFLCLFSYAH